MVRLGLLASGRGSNFVSIVEACQEGELDAEPAVLISNNSDAQVLERAKKRSIPAHYIPFEETNREQFEKNSVSMLKEYDCDLVILAGFMRVLSANFLDHFPGRVLNIHPSLLPSFKGLEAQKQALEYGVKVTGCTVHVVTEEVDSGPIVDQVAVRVEDDDTVESLSKRILKQEHKLFPRAIQKFIDEEVNRPETVKTNS